MSNFTLYLHPRTGKIYLNYDLLMPSTEYAKILLSINTAPRFKKVKKSKPDIAVRNRNYHTATRNHMLYEITQCYLPPGRGDFSAFTPAKAGTRFSDPGGMQG